MKKYKLDSVVTGDTAYEIAEKLREMADQVSKGTDTVFKGSQFEFSVHYNNLFGMVDPQEWSGDAGLNDVHALVAKHQLIQALKLYREKTGLGLKEAKNYIDSIKDVYAAKR